VYQVGNNKNVILWCTANQISRLFFILWGCSCGICINAVRNVSISYR